MGGKRIHPDVVEKIISMRNAGARIIDITRVTGVLFDTALKITKRGIAHSAPQGNEWRLIIKFDGTPTPGDWLTIKTEATRAVNAMFAQMDLYLPPEQRLTGSNKTKRG